jgi:hypothetical protein
MCNMLKTKKTNPIPPVPQASFLKFATFPRDRKWHISKLVTLPRAPYQPHARNNSPILAEPGHIFEPHPQERTWMKCNVPMTKPTILGYLYRLLTSKPTKKPCLRSPPAGGLH